MKGMDNFDAVSVPCLTDRPTKLLDALKPV